MRAGVRRVCAAGRAVDIREAAAHLRSPSRLLVTVLLGFAGVAAATSIASFANGTQGVGEIGTVSETQMQPAAQQQETAATAG